MGPEDYQFSNDYLILKPEEATLLDLFLFILPFGYLRLRKLVDCPEEKEESYKSFGNRWVIFISILSQKFLLAIANLLEKWEPMRGKFWRVQTYASEVNCRDWKIGKEENIKLLNDDDTFVYYGAVTVMASNLVYQDCSPPESSVVATVVNSCWKMKLLGCYDFENMFESKARTQATMFQNTATDPNVTVVAFKGTNTIYDAILDLNFSWYNVDQRIGNIHSGFMEALGLQKGTIGWPKELPKSDHQFAYYYLRQQLRDIAKSNDKAKFIFTGHSLGGALAILFVTILSYHNESDVLNKLQAVYTFGQPRVGNSQFVKFMESTSKQYAFKYYRYVYSMDLVPRIPFDIFDEWYKHFGGCVYFNCCYSGQFMEVQPNKNYFSPLWLIPKYLFALWELIRSLMMPLIKFSLYYFEGFKTLLLRFFGLLIPGASAHLCVNYIYLARQGKMPPLKDIQKTLISEDGLEAQQYLNVEKMKISNI
ncbi:uncharacterized protein LOC111007483 isoform X2 [Momordica charantia]|uniref:Uncharacterized protein LOC111007483 isoform X2 n=1 Tax=Momordica charantia TaxID=3673 RepID=A0A6J1C148_MOMCH|nr:uncharacterized protein LOC111007483 isoform X2 [Momordica charantia]